MTTPADTPTRVRRGGWSVVGGVLAVPAVLLILAAVIIGPQLGIQAANDAAARGVESSLRDVPLPAGAELVDSIAVAGKLSGNGNGMQYLGALLIRSDRTMSELQAHYDSQTSAGDLTIEVSGSQGLNGLHRTPGFLGEPGGPGTFLVFAWGDGPGPLFEDSDIRGH
ncbi:PE family protein [Microbacterium maritypicum]